MFFDTLACAGLLCTCFFAFISERGCDELGAGLKPKGDISCALRRFTGCCGAVEMHLMRTTAAVLLDRTARNDNKKMRLWTFLLKMAAV
jgi:hypothetical protein